MQVKRTLILGAAVLASVTWLYSDTLWLGLIRLFLYHYPGCRHMITTQKYSVVLAARRDHTVAE